MDNQPLNPIARSIHLELKHLNDGKHSTSSSNAYPAPKKPKIQPSTSRATKTSAQVENKELLSAISAATSFKAIHNSNIEILEKYWKFNINLKIIPVEPKDDYVCILCKKKFTMYEDLRIHVIRQHTPGAHFWHYFKCGGCSVQSEFLDDMRIHYTIYHASDMRRQKDKKCSYCKDVFIKDQFLISHLIVSHFLLYKCCICDSSNLKPYQVFKHYLTHYPDFPKLFQLPHCDYVSNDMLTVSKHKATQHVSKKCYICHQCSKTFDTSEKYKTHIWCKQHELCQVIHNCQMCGLKTLDSNLHISHNIREKKYSDFPYRCFKCCRRFASEENLQAHNDICKQGSECVDKNQASAVSCITLEDEPKDSEQNAWKISEVVSIVIDPFEGSSVALTSQDEPNELKERYISLLKMKKWDVKLALIYDVDEERCKMCKIPITCDDEIQAHFKTHFSPCCGRCKLDKPCDEHKRPLFRHSENYYMKLTQHELKTLVVEDRSMTYCIICGFVTSSAREIDILKGIFYQCPECGISHCSREEHIAHLLSHLAFLMCQCCSSQIQNFKEVYQHMMSHEKSQNYICVSCDLLMENEDLLIKHIRGCKKNVVKRMEIAVKKTDTLYGQLEEMFVSAKSCVQCNIEFLSEERLQKHLLAHPRLMCPICCSPAKSMLSHCQKFHQTIFQIKDESLTSITSLKASIKCSNPLVMKMLLPFSALPQLHYKASLIKNKTNCRVCLMPLRGNKDIEAHFRIHLTPCCLSCNIPQRTSCDLHQRLNFQHPENYFVNFSCHRISNSPDGKAFKCTKCPLTFTTDTEIDIISSYFKTSFRCDECSNDRLKITNIELHILEHLVTKACNLCDFISSSSAEIREHVGSAHGGFQCGWCANKSYSQTEHKRHLEVCMQGLLSYLGRSPTDGYYLKNTFLHCDLCEMMFSSDSYKNEHDKKFHMVPMCPFCGQKVPSLREHVLANHWKLIKNYSGEREPFIVLNLKQRANKIKTQIASIPVSQNSRGPKKL